MCESILEESSIVGINSIIEHNSNLGKCIHVDCGGIVCTNSNVSMLSKENTGEVLRSEKYSFEIGV